MAKPNKQAAESTGQVKTSVGEDGSKEETRVREFVPIQIGRSSDDPVDPLMFYNKKDKGTQVDLNHDNSPHGSISSGKVKTSHKQPRYSGGGDYPTIVQEWHQTSGFHHMMVFNLEFWWLHSSKAERIAAGMAGICLVLFFVQFGYGGWCIYKGIVGKVKSPYICRTKECVKASVWISSTMNTSVQPCDNFYEYVCGNTPNDTFVEDRFNEYIRAGGFPFVPGEDSILAKILDSNQNQTTLDQTSKYYQTCLELYKRGAHGLVAFFDKLEHIYGTRDFTTFEASTTSLEDVGARMMETAGHISFLTMAFHVYPYIEVQSVGEQGFPIEMRFDMAQDANATHIINSWDNPEFVKILVENILANLNVPAGSVITGQVITGVDVMTSLMFQLQQLLVPLDGFGKNIGEITGNAAFVEKMNKIISDGYCPPMKIQLDIELLLKKFLGEEFRIVFADLLAAKVYAGLKMCFAQPSATFTVKNISHPRSAFVGLWLIHFFFQSLPATDIYGIMKKWGFTTNRFPYNLQLRDLIAGNLENTEYNCRNNLFKFFGYTPSIEYLLTSITNDGKTPAEFLKSLESIIEKTYFETGQELSKIPAGDISTVDKHLGMIQFQRGIHIDIGLPLASGVFDESAISDNLNITNDHLRNSLNGQAFVIEKARMNWIASTNSEPNVRWFGYGGRLNLLRQLFGLQEAMVSPARFVEKELAGMGKGEWETFLGRKYPNYVFYPLSLLGQPHYSETLALWFASYKLKLIVSILELNDQQSVFFYHSLHANNKKLAKFGNPETDNGADRKCKMLVNTYDVRKYWECLFAYCLRDKTLYEFSPWKDKSYNVIFALREGLKLFREARKTRASALIDWNTDPFILNATMKKFLPNYFENVSEDQLYFIGFVRNYCIGSFKKGRGPVGLERWELEMEVLKVLMQTKEFAEVWKCKKHDFMSNKGHPRCLQH